MKQNPPPDKRAAGRGWQPGRDGAPPVANVEARASASIATPEAVLEAVEAARLILFNWSPDGGLDNLNEAGREALGLEPPDAAHDRERAKRLVNAESAAALASTLIEMQRGALPLKAEELCFLSKEGKAVWLEARLMPVRAGDGSLVGLKGVALEATALVEGRQESADGWEHYRRLFQEAPVAMWLVDAERDLVLEANGLACEMHGYGEGELDGARLADLIPADDWPTAHERLRQWQGSGKVEIVERAYHQRKNGERFPVQLFGGKVVVGGRTRRLSFIEDLGKREAAEGKARAIHAAADGAFDGLVVVGTDGRIVFANAAAAAALAREAEDLVGETVAGLLGDGAAGWKAALDGARQGQPFKGVFEILRADGREVAAQAELRAAGRAGGEFAVLTLWLGSHPAREAEDAADWESEIFLGLLQLHVEDLFNAARLAFAKAPETVGPRDAAAIRGMEAWQTLDKAGAFLKVYGDLSNARGAGGRWSPAERVRAIGELVSEAMLRARPLLPTREAQLRRKIVETGAVSHAALAREALVCLLSECMRSAANSGTPLEVDTASAMIKDRRAVKVTMQGPTDLQVDRARFALCRRAADAVDGLLHYEPGSGDGLERPRVELTLPLA